jgi:hypothetical protein
MLVVDTYTCNKRDPEHDCSPTVRTVLLLKLTNKILELVATIVYPSSSFM